MRYSHVKTLRHMRNERYRDLLIERFTMLERAADSCALHVRLAQVGECYIQFRGRLYDARMGFINEYNRMRLQIQCGNGRNDHRKTTQRCDTKPVQGEMMRQDVTWEIDTQAMAFRLEQFGTISPPGTRTSRKSRELPEKVKMLQTTML